MAQFGSALEWGSRGRRFKSSYPDQSHGGIAQLVERLNGIQEVAGSTPTISTKNSLNFCFRLFFYIKNRFVLHWSIIYIKIFIDYIFRGTYENNRSF